MGSRVYHSLQEKDGNPEKNETVSNELWMRVK